MANYILSLDKGKGDFEEIFWNNLPKYKSSDNHSLSAIDDFTVCFKSEEDLKKVFLENGFLTSNNINKKLCIRYKSRGKTKKLGYGLLYCDDQRFLDEVHVTYYLESNLNNLALLEKLCNHYRSSYIQGSNINAIRNYINLVSNGCDLWPEDINAIHGAIKDFVIREVFSYDASTYTYKVDKDGNPIVKYKGLHDLGAFLAYDSRKRLKKDEEIAKEKDKPIRVIIADKPKTKTLNKKNTQVPGQISLFDK